MSAVFVGVSADPPSFWTPESVVVSPLRSGQGERGCWINPEEAAAIAIVLLFMGTLTPDP